MQQLNTSPSHVPISPSSIIWYHNSLVIFLHSKGDYSRSALILAMCHRLKLYKLKLLEGRQTLHHWHSCLYLALCMCLLNYIKHASDRKMIKKIKNTKKCKKKLTTTIFTISAFVSVSDRTSVTKQEIFHVQHVTKVARFHLTAHKIIQNICNIIRGAYRENDV